MSFAYEEIAEVYNELTGNDNFPIFRDYDPSDDTT